MKTIDSCSPNFYFFTPKHATADRRRSSVCRASGQIVCSRAAGMWPDRQNPGIKRTLRYSHMVIIEGNVDKYIRIFNSFSSDLFSAIQWGEIRGMWGGHVSSILIGNEALELNCAGLLQHRKWVPFSLMFVSAPETQRVTSRWSLPPVFPSGEPLTLAQTHPITLTMGQHLVNHCFPSTPFILNQEVWHAVESSWLRCQRTGCDPSCSLAGCGYTDKLQLKLCAHGCISWVCGLQLACTFS